MTHRTAGIKYDIKVSAETTRAKRIHARTLHGMERHYAKDDAYDPYVRWLLLAYGYLRGRTIAQMESETTRWENRPDATRILSIARQHFTDARPETAEEWVAFNAAWAPFEAMVKADIQQWHARLIIKNAEKKAQKIQRAVA